jgi:hypothetical protein
VARENGAVSSALVEEATRRSGVVWLLVPGVARAQPVWHLWHEGAAHLVAGGGEQRLDGVDDGVRVLVVVRSRERQADRVVQWWATAQVRAPGTPEWDALVPLLSARRLNARDAAQQPQRWAQDSVVLSLVPDGTEEPVRR